MFDDVESVDERGDGEREGTKGMSAQRNVADVGRDTIRLDNQLRPVDIPVAMNLPAPVPNPVAVAQDGLATGTPHPPSAADVAFFHTSDMNIDPRVQAQWARHEIPFQTNTTAARNGQVWVKNWEALGPLDPFTPRTPDGKVIPGPTDPQTAYGLAIAGALNGQAEKFCVTENPNDVTYAYRNSLQQLPGSHYVVQAVSFDPYETPQVVNRFALLPEMAAKWVVAKLNEKLRAEHPCFSLSGREHFEQQNPPANCGDVTNQKQNPITLIRIFEARIKRVRGSEDQLLYLTMEIANHITGGSGGQFETVVTIDNKGNFVGYTTPQRDMKQTFVLPRSRS